MKKILKILIIVILIFFILFIMNLFRNYLILNKIYNLGNNFIAGNNYHLKEEITTNIGKTIINYYYKDNIYLYNEYTENLDNSTNNVIIWNNINTNEYIHLENNELDTTNINSKSNYIDDFIYCKSYKREYLLKENLFNIIKKSDQYYIINLSNNDEYVYVENGLLGKILSSKNNINLTVTFEKDTVTNQDIDIENYNNKNV
jgi:hypothetical protein